MMRARSVRSAKPTASIFSAPTASASRIPGIGCASAARLAATIPRNAAQGLGCDLLEFRRLHHHHRAISRHRRLGHDHAGLLRQGHLHPLCARATSRMPSTTTIRSKAAVLYAEPGGYYEHGLDFGKASRRLRGRPLEIQADPRRRACRRDGGLGRQGRGQGTLVHGELRRRCHLSRRSTPSFPPRARWSPTSRTSRWRSRR